MQLTIQVKLLPDTEQQVLIENTMQEYINTVNSIVQSFVLARNSINLTSRNIQVLLPSCLINQAIRDAKSVYKKYSKAVKANSKKSPDKQRTIKVPVLKKPVAIWNNQNFKLNALESPTISFPVWTTKSTRLKLPILLTEYQRNLLNNKLGTLRITKKSNKLIAQISVDVPINSRTGNLAMGIDLGLKIPAVAVTENNKVKFFGNGRENKFKKRKFRSQRKSLGKAKKLKALKKINNKEQRWMKDKDHKISQQIINFALANNVSVIRLEQLSGIRQTARTSRKNNKNLHTWSFYRLAQFIEYKAVLSGISVEYVKPAYTSQICPACGTKNKADDRNYTCSCGYHSHRDIIGAYNIIYAPLADGNSLSA